MDEKNRVDIGIIGVGNIGSSILRGLQAANFKGIGKIFINDAEKEKLQYFESGERVKICKSNEGVAKKSNLIILAVKPKDIEEVVREISYFFNEEKILVSVAAGVPTSLIESEIEKKVKVIRVMPNIASQVEESVSAICKGKYANKKDEEVVEGIFHAIGSVCSVEEKYMDVITGLSGSGVAFFAAMIDAMADGGVYEGLPKELSSEISAKTALGAAKMILAGKKPSEIKEKVASPGGATIRGLYAMEARGVKATVMKAVIEATKRAREISVEQ